MWRKSQIFFKALSPREGGSVDFLTEREMRMRLYLMNNETD